MARARKKGPKTPRGTVQKREKVPWGQPIDWSQGGRETLNQPKWDEISKHNALGQRTERGQGGRTRTEKKKEKKRDLGTETKKKGNQRDF